MKYILLASLLFAIDSFAAPRPMVLCVDSRGRILTKERCGRGEKVFNLQYAAQIAVRAVQLTPGTFDPQKCVTRLNQYSLIGTQGFSVECAPGEYLMTYGFTAFDNEAALNTAQLRTLNGGFVAKGVDLFFKAPDGWSYTVESQLICCLP